MRKLLGLIIPLLCLSACDNGNMFLKCTGFYATTNSFSSFVDPGTDGRLEEYSKIANTIYKKAKLSSIKYEEAMTYWANSRFQLNYVFYKGEEKDEENRFDITVLFYLPTEVYIIDTRKDFVNKYKDENDVCYNYVNDIYKSYYKNTLKS